MLLVLIVVGFAEGGQKYYNQDAGLTEVPKDIPEDATAVMLGFNHITEMVTSFICGNAKNWI